MLQRLVAYKIIIIIVVVSTTVLGSGLAWYYRATSEPKNIAQLVQKYRDKQTRWTAHDTQNCLDDYARITSADKPKQQQASSSELIALNPPCPGIEQ